jgi:hypothetical protein
MSDEERTTKAERKAYDKAMEGYRDNGLLNAPAEIASEKRGANGERQYLIRRLREELGALENLKADPSYIDGLKHALILLEKET